MKPEHIQRHADRLLERARTFADDPNDMDKRVAYMRAAFNHDWTAAAIVALADRAALRMAPQVERERSREVKTP